MNIDVLFFLFLFFNIDVLNIPLFWSPVIFLSLYYYFFNAMELQKIEVSELPLPLRSPWQCSGKEEGAAFVPLARMDAVSKSGQKRKYTSRLNWLSFFQAV